MNIVFILAISTLLQLAALFLAFRLIRITKRRASWILIVSALFLMEIRRFIPLLQIVTKNPASTPDPFAELVALATSVLMVAGIALIAPLFRSIKRSEEVMQESREWLSTTLTSIGDAVIATDTQGSVTFMNPVAQALTGWSQDEAAGKHLTDIFTIIDEKTGKLREDPTIQVIEKNEVTVLEHNTLLVAKNGKQISIDDSAAPIKNNQGEVIGTVLVFRDTSERKIAEEKIKRAYGELDQLFNTAAGGMRVIDKNFTVTRVNETFSTLSGVKRGEAVGKKCYEVFHGPFCHTPNCCLTRILSGEQRIEGDIEKERGDGTKIFCLVTATPYLGPHGELAGIVENFQNIDERKRTEELLRRAKMVIENSPTVLFRWKVKEGWPVEFVSENVATFGYKPQELLDGKIPYISIVHPEDVDRVRQETKKNSALGNQHFQHEYRIITKSGEVRWVDARTLAEYDADGRITHYQGIIIDITERKQAAEALKLKEEQERLSIILDGNPIPTFVIDQNHNVVSWNRACEALTGASKEQALGKPVNSGIFYQGQTRPVLADLVLDMDTKLMSRFYTDKGLSQSASIPEAFEAKDLLFINGTPRNLYFLAHRLRDSSGEVKGAIETIQDVTEWEQLQKQFLHAQKMEAIGRLAGGVAHDFNNLLVIIRGYSEFLLGRMKEGAPMYREIEMIRKAGERAASLTRQLLAFSRGQMLQPKILDLNELITDMQKMLRRLIGEDIVLTAHLEPNLERIKADPGQIEQVIMNLAVNARDAMPKGGSLNIRTENVTRMVLEKEPGYAASEAAPGGFVCLSVSDTGVGIDKGIIDHIFEPFFSTKELGKGTGLGLSTVYGIVKQHEGFIHVESEAGQGATFRVYLPALAITRPEDETLKVISPLKSRGSGERILLVEDEDEVREYTLRMLRENGFCVFEAASAEEALDIFEKEKGNIHLVFSDVALPGQNGLELVEQLLSRKPQLRVLLCSGYTDEKSQWPLIRERNFRFLKKPFTLNNLLQAVKEALKAKG
ncbi:MAG: PAS domain S-box protein [bacterium]